ncbi:MAG: AAA family ATPase [Culicoidibacterales bacterium]
MEKLDLRDKDLYVDAELDCSKKINLIYGKNGAGKSTLTKLIREQAPAEYAVHIFQGFDGVVGQADKLDAIVLGQENSEIETQIEALEQNKKGFEEEIQRQQKLISEPENEGEINIFSRLAKANTEYEDQVRKKEQFMIQSAKEIKKQQTPPVAPPTYNKISFEADIENAQKLEPAEVLKLEATILSKVKKAKKVQYSQVDFSKYLKAVNELLEAIIPEEVVIPRINDNHKREFAKNGLELHTPGELCSFCGNQIADETLHELKTYFSADEIKRLKERITSGKQQIDKQIDLLNSVCLDSNDFYPSSKQQVDELTTEFNDLKQENIDFLERLLNALTAKEANLFDKSPKLNLGIPNSVQQQIKTYNEYVQENNQYNLQQLQNEAKEKLRLHYVKLAMDQANYFGMDSQLQNLHKIKQDIEDEKRGVDTEISNLDEKVADVNTKIRNLELTTKNEKIVVDKINKLLKSTASFELVHIDSDHQQGYYQVKCNRSGEIRAVSKLSAGEKNIIAFLYFLYKLEAINPEGISAKKIIVFDDPMTSNDDTMQYIIITELQALQTKIKKASCNDKLFILTHNTHFYLNVTEPRTEYWYKNKKNYNVFKLNKLDVGSEILKIEDKSLDFSTSYEQLWQDLTFLYKSGKPELMLNTIRRILETYIKFNNISQNNFYNHNMKARKLFNVNSHSIDDLEAELNGETCQGIIDVMKSCFENNNATSHFDKYWTI